jgi:hypothetical protein
MLRKDPTNLKARKTRYLEEHPLNRMMMSTPDALPTEIALIALLLFKFQVYSTFLRHYYHRPVIGMKNDIPWIIKFFIYYISNQNPILLTTGAVGIKSADYTC